jgi:hypothetical protein
MTTITLRDTKGSPLTHEEMDDNFSNLNEASIPSGGTAGQVLTKDTTADYDVSWQTTTPSLTDLVSDTSPQLGGSLDVNGQSIVSVSNGNIPLAPNGSGKVLVGNGANAAIISSSGATTLTLETNSGGNSGSISVAPGLTGNITLNHQTGKVLIGNSANIATISSNGFTSLRLETNSGSNSGSIVMGAGTGAAISITPSAFANINLDSGAFGKVAVGNSANIATITSSGPTILRLETNSGSNSGSIQLSNGLSGNITLEHGAFGKVLVSNATFANTAIISSAGDFPLTLSSGAGNTASIVLQSGPTGNVVIETAFGGSVLVGNQLFGNVAILSSSGAFPLTLNTNAGNTASVVIQSGPSAEIQLTTGFAGKVTIGNQLFANVALLTSAGDFPLTLSSGAGNTASVRLENGPSGNIVLETAFGGSVLITNQLFGNTAILSSGGAFPLTLNTNAGNTASITLESGPTANVILETGFAGKVLIGNQLFGNTAIISTNGSFPLTLEAQTDIILEPTGKTLISKPILTKPVYSIGTASGTQTPNATNGEWQTITLDGNLTLNAFASPANGQTIKLIIKQDATGSRTLTSSMLWEDGSKTLSTAANAVDIATIYYDGTNYWASLTKGYA